VSFAENDHVREYVPDNEGPLEAARDRDMKRRGILPNLIDLYGLNHGGGGLSGDDEDERRERVTDRQSPRSASDYSMGYSSARPDMRRADSMGSMMSVGSDFLDPDDPRVTGITKEYLDDPEDLEKNALRQMDYKARRKERQRIRIEFNISCVCPSFPTQLVLISASTQP
jgi:hypothetical protein